MGTADLIGTEPDGLASPRALHHGLACFNARRWAGTERPAAGAKGLDGLGRLDDEWAWRRRESEFLEALREDVALLLPSPDLAPDAFVAWFEGLAKHGPGQRHRLMDWLADSATLEDLQWFLRQESAGEAGLPASSPVAWPSLALANAMRGLSTSPRYAYQSIGALGVVELIARKRAKQLSRGMRRLGLKCRALAATEGRPSTSALQAIRPLVVADSGCARLIAEGALMRLLCAKHCLDWYAKKLMPPARLGPCGARSPGAT